MNRDFGRFLFRLSLFLAPFAVVSVLPFAVFDPFKILYRYDNFSAEHIDGYAPWLNTNYITTETFLRGRKTIPYDSFVFGSSRTNAYRCEEWKRHAKQTSCFIYGTSGENLFGIWSKVRLLDRLGQPIKNALVVLDATILSKTTESDEMPYVEHPVVSGRSWLRFYRTFVRAYFSDLFFLKFAQLRLFGKFRPYMKGVFNSRELHFDSITNECLFLREDEVLATNPDQYYESRAGIFYQRPKELVVGPSVLSAEQKQMLTEIRDIFARAGTDVKVIINPLYDQIAFNPKDLGFLQSQFGAEHVFDFSGVNRFTQNQRNYYETSHFRAHIGKEIFEQLYKPVKP